MLFRSNTEISLHGDQRLWLQRQLKSKRPLKKWLITNYHRPAYPAVKRPGGAKAAWVPLFETYQVDLAVESDGHVYKQTEPIYQDKVNREKGVIYVGEGGLGVKQREPKENRWYLKGSGMALAVHHFQLISIGHDMTFEAVDQNGNTFSMIKAICIFGI